MPRFILRYIGEGDRPTIEFPKWRNVRIIESSPRMLLIEADSAPTLNPCWIVAPEQKIPLPDVRPKPISVPEPNEPLVPWTVPQPVFIQACRDFEARRLNGGCWVGGKIPDSILRIKELYRLDSNIAWVQVVEGIVGMMAISVVSKLNVADLMVLS